MTARLNNCSLRDVVGVSGRNFGAWGVSMTSCMRETVKNILLSTVLFKCPEYSCRKKT